MPRSGLDIIEAALPQLPLRPAHIHARIGLWSRSHVSITLRDLARQGRALTVVIANDKGLPARLYSRAPRLALPPPQQRSQ